MIITANNQYSQQPSFTARRINITKEQILELRARGLLEKDIVKELGINQTTYYEKLKKLGLSSKTSNHQEKLSKISVEEFENHLKNKTPVSEICKIFDITPSMYKSIIRKHNLMTPEKAKRLNAQNITKEQLEKLLASGKSAKEICEELNISFNTYKKSSYIAA